MPRAFKTEVEFVNAVKEYVGYCVANDRLPNVAGFCVWRDINRDTFYAQKEIYPDTYKKVNDIFEDEALNTGAVNDTLKIFYLKNKCGYKDKQEVTADISYEKAIKDVIDENEY